ncbi:MAG: amidase, partial [Thermomicrobiales bacterium]|nr:amidase [Thermomicrobiales bacterium]
MATLIERREVSPIEVVTAALERAETDGPYYNTYITVLAEQAIEEARTAEQEILQGNYRGPLHGIPLSIKDIYWTKGVRTTVGSRVLSDFVPDEDATVVARLRDAGGILIAKANTYQFACSPPIR